MTQKPSNPPESLRAMLTQALQTYELAKATRLQAERKAQEEYQQRLKALQAEQRAEIRELEAEQKREIAAASAEQERLGHLLSAIEQVEQSARDLLGKAGLAHIAGAPLRVDDSAAKSRYSDQAVAAAFSAAQTAYVDLRTALLRLAQAYTDAEQWEEARRVLQPLLEDQKAPLYVDARSLSRQVHLKIAQIALDTERLDDAKAMLRDWLNKHGGSPDIEALLCETYYRLGQRSIESQDWVKVADYLRAIRNLTPDYRDTKEWPRHHPISLWRTGLIRCKTALQNNAPVVSVAFSPDGEQLVTATAEFVRVWDVKSMRELRLIELHYIGMSRFLVHKILFRDNTTIFVCGKYPEYKIGEYFQVVNIGSGALITIDGKGWPKKPEIVMIDSELMIKKTNEDTLIIQDDSENTLVTLSHPGGINDFDFSPVSKLLATAGKDGTVRIWEAGE